VTPVKSEAPSKGSKTRKPKAVASKKSKAPSNHPKYLEMAESAIGALKERNGSSRQAVHKYILAHFNVGHDVKAVNTHLKQALKRGVALGKLRHVKGQGASGSFKLADSKPVAKPAAVKNPKPSVAAKPKVEKKPKKKSVTKPKKAKESPKKAKPSKKKSPKKAVAESVPNVKAEPKPKKEKKATKPKTPSKSPKTAKKAAPKKAKPVSTKKKAPKKAAAKK